MKANLHFNNANNGLEFVYSDKYTSFKTVCKRAAEVSKQTGGVRVYVYVKETRSPSGAVSMSYVWVYFMKKVELNPEYRIRCWYVNGKCDRCDTPV